MCPIFLSDTKASWNLSTNFSEIQHDDWHQNLSIGNRVVSCGQMDGWTQVTKLTVAFVSYCALSPKRYIVIFHKVVEVTTFMRSPYPYFNGI